MVTFLSRFLIKDYKNTTDTKVRQAYGMLCGAVGIVLNIFLFIGKALAGYISGSIAITADAFNNLSDAGSSVITLVGFKMAGQKPDSDHPFGHGRIEYISGFLVSVVILIMAFELLKSSVEKILHPSAIESGPVIIGILVASILVKVYMFLYNRGISKKIDSAAMDATAKDSLSDTIATFAVLGTTLLAQFTGLQIDIAGKSGSVQENLSRANHATFISYGPYNDPKISVTVAIPHGYMAYNAAVVCRYIYQYYFGYIDMEDILDKSYNTLGESATYSD